MQLSFLIIIFILFIVKCYKGDSQNSNIQALSFVLSHAFIKRFQKKIIYVVLFCHRLYILVNLLPVRGLCQNHYKEHKINALYTEAV